jgi:NAD(P)-dependent dehydrogenase (short-subunit alcohol dehydrogenase family)/acyl carrier protein
MEQRGLLYGPSFQAVTEIWRGAGEALARLQLPTLLVPEQKSYRIHPALLDAGLQIIAAADAPAADADASYLPVGIGALRVHGRPPAQLWCHAALRPDESPRASVRTADIALLDEDGRAVVEITGLRVRRVGQQQAALGRPEDWLYQVEWQPRERGEPAAGSAGGTAGVWLIFSDRGAVGAGLAELLEGCGETAVLVQAAAEGAADDGQTDLRIRPDDPAEYRRLVRAVQQRHGGIQGVVHLWSLDAPAADSAADLDTAQTLGSLSATYLAQALLADDLTPKVWLVTRGAQQVADGQAGLAVEQAPLWGLGRVLGQQEQLALWGGLIDLDPAAGEHDAAQLFEEVLAPDGDDQIAFREGRRHTARLVRAELPQRQPARLRADASYLITGGLGALGLLVARWMVGQGARRIILMGRTALPPRREWARAAPDSPAAARIAAVRGLEALGASVLVAPVDLTDAQGLAAFLESYAEEGWPPIRGVVYAAGVVRDQLIQHVDPDTFWRILRPKLHGAWLLERLLEGQPLDFFTIFGSAAALIGLPGQSVYAAANAFLDALAQRAARAGRPAVSIGWGPWSAGMEDALGLGEFHALRGMHALPTEQALALAGALMRRGPAQIAVCAADWPRVCESYPLSQAPALLAHLASERQAGPAAAQAGSVLADILAAEAAEQPGLVERHIQALIGRVMRMDVARIDPHQPLNNLGIDSMMATELKNSVALSLGVNLSVVDLLQGVSAAQLGQTCLAQLQARAQSERLAALAASGAAVSAQELETLTADIDTDDIERLLREIDQLSDDEIESVLSAEARA